MSEQFDSPGFVGKRRGGEKKIASRLVSISPTISLSFPRAYALHAPDRWTFNIEGLVKEKLNWSWQDFLILPMQKYAVYLRLKLRGK